MNNDTIKYFEYNQQAVYLTPVVPAFQDFKVQINILIQEMAIKLLQ